MPPAARITDMHICKETRPIPHIGGPIITGCDSVLIGHQPAARIGDSAKCVPDIDKIVEGEPTVVIGFKIAARKGDKTDGGKIVAGCPTVLIGSEHGEECLTDAASEGTPFVSTPDP
ncbi:MAG: PAAR domain-containing protein [Polyangiaceae bacterium]|nr:PAAR domain-containing protein [Polyangiaceae bacterium]